MRVGAELPGNHLRVQQLGRGASHGGAGLGVATLASPLASRKPFLVPAAAPVTPGRPSQYRAWWPWSPLADSRGEGAPVPTGPKVPIIAVWDQGP